MKGSGAFCGNVHAQRGDCLAKVWVQPSVAVAECYGFHSSELKQLVSVIEENAGLIEGAWNEYFG